MSTKEVGVVIKTDGQTASVSNFSKLNKIPQANRDR